MTNTTTHRAMFGAGCFWGVELAFGQIEGVLTTEVGFAGGQVKDPTYEQVCEDTTGHAEVVHLTFDPAKISYQKLVEAFFNLHNPTQLNRQGNDIGGQYRSAIFVTDDHQQAIAQSVKDTVQAASSKPIVTTIEPWATFYRASEHHQNYLAKRGKASCRIN